MVDKVPTKSEIFNAVSAQSATVDELSKRISSIENLASKQDDRNRNIIIAVLFATVIMVATVAVQVSISDGRDRERTDNLLNQVHQTKDEQQLKIFELQNQQTRLELQQMESQENIDLIRSRNSYLR